eukprot:6183350-Pleurochrysis_carterae.AAC.1
MCACPASHLQHRHRGDWLGATAKEESVLFCHWPAVGVNAAAHGEFAARALERDGHGVPGVARNRRDSLLQLRAQTHQAIRSLSGAQGRVGVVGVSCRSTMGLVSMHEDEGEPPHMLICH